MLEGDKVIYIEKMHKATPEKLYRQIGAGDALHIVHLSENAYFRAIRKHSLKR